LLASLEAERAECINDAVLIIKTCAATCELSFTFGTAFSVHAIIVPIGAAVVRVTCVAAVCIFDADFLGQDSDSVAVVTVRTNICIVCAINTTIIT